MMNKAIVLFSGGIDSSYTAIRSIKDYDRIILITYRTPGMINFDLAANTAKSIKKLFPEKIEHRTIDIRDFLLSGRGGISRCIKDNFKYRFFYSWCLGCKLGMHLYTINICLKEEIKAVMDGSSFYDAHALEQSKECKDFFSKLYSDRGLHLFSPFYYENKEKRPASLFSRLLSKIGLYKQPTGSRADYLRSLGIDPGPSFISQHRTIQPSCVTSLFFNFPRVFLRLFHKEEKKYYLKYLEDSLGRYKDPPVQ